MTTLFTPESLVVYFVLGFFLCLVIVFFNQEFTSIMSWSLTTIKKAQLKSSKSKNLDKEMSLYQKKIDDEIVNKPPPKNILAFFYIILLLTCWPLVCLLPIFALLIEIFYLSD